MDSWQVHQSAHRRAAANIVRDEPLKLTLPNAASASLVQSGAALQRGEHPGKKPLF
jgi:hypothetical protein